MPALRPCLTCGRLTRGSSYCRMHAPVHPSPSSLHGLRRAPSLRRQALERDGHRCVRCGSARDLRVHHRLGVAEGGPNALWNLVTLCDPCHLAEHRAERARQVEEQAEAMLLLGGFD